VSANLYDQLRARFPSDLQRTFLEVPGGVRLDYATLEAETARIANRLSALGVARGDRVAVQVEKSPEAVLLYLACLRAGFVFLPLNPAYRAEEVSYFVGDAEPSLFVCDPERESEVAPGPALFTLGADGRGSLLEGLSSESSDHELVPVGSDEAAAILYTSGTTGRSKGAVLTHANLASNALALHEAWGFEPDDVLLHVLPVFHAHGLFVALHTTLLNGT